MLDTLTLLRAMNGIYEEDVATAGGIYLGSGKARHFRAKRVVAAALAAVMILGLSAAAYAVNQAVGTPQAAERVARQETEVWKQMGLLNPEVVFEGDANMIVEIPERNGGESWYGRLFAHSYDVRWYISKEGAKYGCNLTIDTLSGKILAATIDARADADAVPVREEVLRHPLDPENPDGEQVEMPLRFYDNFTDIFPADMTVDCFCTLLAEYWDFSGYRLAETVDNLYFDEPQAAVDPNSLLKDMNDGAESNYYLTVFFEGDQPGAPMYIQLNQFPGYVSLALGTRHAVG